MKAVYVETSVWSYLTARPVRDILGAARQHMTLEWWEKRRSGFQLFISPLVLQEAGRGDAEAASRRLDAMSDYPVLRMEEEAYRVAKELLDEGALPSSAEDDALHIALAAVHQMDYLLTWNCRHIDNAEVKPLARLLCLKYGYTCPEICTPEELMGKMK